MNFHPRVLVNCEFSGVLRRALRARGVNAWSCDLLASEDDSPYHIRADAIETAYTEPWDAMIAFPPCTDLSNSGARWHMEKIKLGLVQAGAAFFMNMIKAPIEKIAVENPIGVMNTWYRKPDQIIQPWQFGHGETKATCLWLKGFPKLTPTNIVSGREPRIHYMAPGPNRARERSRTYAGIAEAMALQWFDSIPSPTPD